ncbi:transcription factor [Ganoderma sinense ZZ0214-1]|uniref:Transcription factor n=1 Tax=Ganoderma sinense ZZ0214-1 TaxID=1077348 RepID=A0A2G8STL5_9APHY|nr:transcription factor [Ganoderma sinense ZZ0214-1]
MAAMQTQPQQLQAAGGVPNAISTSGPTMVPQQPPAFPNFVLQPHQPQIPGPSSVPQLGGQPWVLPALPTNAPLPIGAQSNATAKQPTVDEIVAGVVAAMKANAPQEEAPDKSLARFAPDDERVLVNELRKAKREGLTPLQGISKLDQITLIPLRLYKVNNHTAAAWKDYFIKHVERLSPKVYPQAYANTVPLKSTAGGSRSGGQSTSSSQPRHPVTNGDLSDSEQSNSDEEAAVGGSAASRSKRGAPVVEYHDEVRIPHLASGVKPKPPQRDLQHNNRRFTKEDKVFFIHYLKYRLRKGPVPSKEQLYGELTEQAPHHNADSWKRHWDKACTLPNQIYIQALKRVNSRRQEPRRPAPRAKQDPAESSEAEDEEEDEEEEGDATPAEPSDDPVSEPTASRKRAPTAKKAQGGPVPHRCKVSDEDIRAMAQYIVEKRKCDGWEALKGPDRWEEFASRPENIKRRLNAWIGITYSRARDIQAYIQEYESEQSSTPAAEDKPRASPTVDRASDLRQGDPKAGQAKDAMRSATKRALEGEESKIEGSRSPTQKRPKLVKPEAIVISD